MSDNWEVGVGGIAVGGWGWRGWKGRGGGGLYISGRCVRAEVGTYQSQPEAFCQYWAWALTGGTIVQRHTNQPNIGITDMSADENT